MISYPRVLLFGDSITELAFETNGWAATLAKRLVRKCDVLNRGLSGYNTRLAKPILPKLIPDSARAADIAAVTIFFGANDSSIREENPQQHVPLGEYTENLRSMVQYLKSVNIKEEKIVLITPPPIHEPTLEKHCLTNGFKLNRLNAVTGAYARACAQVGDEYGADVVDLWTLMQEGGSDHGVYLKDGLHLSEEGNQFLESKLWHLLEKKLGALPFILPYWNDVDNNNPESSLFQSIAEKKD